MISRLHSNITGTVQFIQETKESNVTIIAKFSGLTPGQHGFHIHGNPVTTDCDSTGGHYNPRNITHGAWDANARHVGDMQALIANANGEASFTYSDPVIKLEDAANSILGRAIVIHANADDFGLGGNDASTKTGNAGARLVCANITLF
jgi:Cu-Zn family superoxide dismutase